MRGGLDDDAGSGLGRSYTRLWEAATVGGGGLHCWPWPCAYVGTHFWVVASRPTTPPNQPHPRVPRLPPTPAPNPTPRVSQEVSVLFNLCNEPWLKYTLSAIADRGMKHAGWTSARLRAEVLFLETNRWGKCEGGGALGVKSASAEEGREGRGIAS